MEGSEESRKNETLSLCRALSIVSAVGRAGGGAPVLDIHYRKFHDFKFGIVGEMATKLLPFPCM